MKGLYIALVVVSALLVLLGVFFVFGDDLFLGYYSEGAAGDEIGYGSVDGDRAGGISGSSDSDLAGGGESDTVAEGDLEPSCRMQQIQYSLKNFVEDIVCTESGDGGCVNLVANCSMDVYNLDEAGGVFEIEYSLTNSTGGKLDSVMVEKNVDSGEFVMFSAYFVASGDVDEESSCPFIMKSVPMKEICS